MNQRNSRRTAQVNQNNYHVNVPGAVVFGTIFALLVSVALLILGTALMHFTALSEQHTPLMVFGSNMLGILLGSRKAGKQIGVKGWLNGGMVGIGYVIAVVILGFFLQDLFIWGGHVAVRLLLGFLMGAVGGMWGVNS